VSPFDRKIVLFLATGAGAGYAPRIPGTLGTLVAIPLSLGLNQMAVVFPLAVVTLIGSICCYMAINPGRGNLGQKDPGIIVIDEIARFSAGIYTLVILRLILSWGL
jgi:phosphatidylglycerophosphatase A